MILADSAYRRAYLKEALASRKLSYQLLEEVLKRVFGFPRIK